MRHALSILVCATLLSSCSSAPRTIILGTKADPATALLAAHPPEAGRNITPILLEKNSYSSVHLVWVRDREEPHLHAVHDLVVLVLRGEGSLFVNGRERPMAAGDVAAIPAGTPHQFVNRGDEPAAAFVVFSPPSDGSDNVPQ